MSEIKIKVLEDIVSNQIAAGEVVERPASVIKELVENSVDAGATKIQVEIDAGGISRIRVQDNGFGLTSAELELAFQRHATSKMSVLSDLDEISTFGFRGEALPSISSVSKITAFTRIAEVVGGTRLTIEGGNILESREAGCPVGTDITVSELFYNTPARLKFLKRESTEAGHCAEALTRLALVRPEIAFTLISNGRKTRSLPRVEMPHERVTSLFPDDTLAVAEGGDSAVKVLAILGAPERARAGAGSLYTYVNGRFVRDRSLLKAVSQAFAGTLVTGRYPVGFVAITLLPGSFDVNVHPQKTEVRFADGQSVYRAINRTIGEMVARSVWSFGIAHESSEETCGEVSDVQAEYGDLDRGRLVPPPISSPKGRSFGRQGDASESPVSSTPSMNSKAPSGGPVPTSLVGLNLGYKASNKFSALRFIGQAAGTFLVLEDDHDLVLIDQHAAHERVTYERLLKQLASGRVASQRLLSPHNIDLGPAETERIMSLADQLDRLGLEISRSGPDRIAVRSVPAEVKDASPDRLLAEMVLALEDGRKGSRGELDDHAIATIACHGSIRAGRLVNTEEARALLEEMDKIDIAGHCPHGRPVLTRIPWSEIKSRVGRI